MSEHELTFLETLRETYDKKYNRMQAFLLTILGVFLSGFIIVGSGQMSRLSDTSATTKGNEKDITYIMENSVSKKAIDRLIQTFDNQIKIMNEFYPDNIKDGMDKFYIESSRLRSEIMKYNSDLTTRGGGLTNGSAK